MKKITIQSVILFLLFNLMTSCVGYKSQISSTPVGYFSTSKSDFPKKGWQDIDVYQSDFPKDSFQQIARIVIIGSEYISERKMRMEMRREAGKYGADAIINLQKSEVQRSTFNGIAAGLNIISIFSDSDEDDCDCCDDDDEYLDTGDTYTAVQLEGIAIIYTSKK